MGTVIGIDISREMLTLATHTAAALGLDNVDFREGRAEAIPADTASMDVVLASLSLMYVIDRAAAAREIARVRDVDLERLDHPHTPALPTAADRPPRCSRS